MTIDGDSTNKQSFRKEDDIPEVFISKMQNTLKKKKNNYKNIEELKNIYDSPVKPEKQKTTVKPEKPVKPTKSSKKTNISENFDQYGKDLDDFQKKMGSVFSKKSSSGNVSKEGVTSDSTTNQTSSKLNTPTNVYLPEYEFENDIVNVDFNKLLADAKATGNVSIAAIKNLLNTGQITQAQYNTLFSFTLPSIYWEDIKTSIPQPSNECGKFNKDCGSGFDIWGYLKRITDYIKKIIGFYTYLLQYIAGKIYDSNNSNTPSVNRTADINTIASMLNYICMVPFAIFFAYNWFYITFYRDPQGSPIPDNVEENVMKSLKGFLIRLFYCLVRPMLLMNWGFRKIPNIYYLFTDAIMNLEILIAKKTYIGRLLDNPTFIFIILTIIILFMASNYSTKVLDMFLSYISDANVPFASWLHGIVAYDWIIGFAVVSLFTKYASILMALLSPFSAVFWFIVLVVFSHLMIRFAGIFIILFLYIVSYFAIVINVNGGFMTGYQMINNTLKSATQTRNRDCPPNNEDDILTKVIKLLYDLLWWVIYLIVFIVCLTLAFQLKSTSSKFMMTILFGALIACVIFWCGYSINSKKDIFPKNDFIIPEKTTEDIPDKK